MTTLQSVHTTLNNSFLTQKNAADTTWESTNQTWVDDKKDLVVISLMNLFTVNQTEIANSFKNQPVEINRRFLKIKMVLPGSLSTTDLSRIQTVSQCTRNCRAAMVCEAVNQSSMFSNAKTKLINFKIVNTNKLECSFLMELV